MLEQLFIQHIMQRQLFGKHDRLLVAVSGGVDSMVLAALCHHVGLTFEMAHVNFKLRGEESEADERFVRKVAESFHVPLHVNSFDTQTYATEHKMSVQEAARELRYRWFEQLVSERKAFLLTAHHADDNIETVMMHFFRGTGLSGLRGIPEKAGYIVRPLLPFTRKDILHYANEQHVAWREDSSNLSDKYSRNVVRNSVLPLIRKIFPAAEKNIIENISRFTDAELLYQQAIAQHRKSLVETKGDELHLPVMKLKKTEPSRTILYEIVRCYGFSSAQMDDIYHLLDAEQGKLVESPSHRIIRDRKWLIILPRTTLQSSRVVLKKEEGHVSFDGGSMEMKVKSAEHVQLDRSASVAMLDAKQLQYPLILRKWKAGDYFYPLGMPKKKKISRFLIDLKLSRPQKEQVWVLESNKRICWVVGYRIDERFKMREDTREVMVAKVKS